MGRPPLGGQRLLSILRCVDVVVHSLFVVAPIVCVGGFCAGSFFCGVVLGFLSN